MFRFRARDLHLVLGPGADGKPVRFRVTARRQAARRGPRHRRRRATATEPSPSNACTSWCARSTATAERMFEIPFLDPGVQAYAFTFG